MANIGIILFRSNTKDSHKVGNYTNANSVTDKSRWFNYKVLLKI